jgi:hypothetical protein
LYSQRSYIDCAISENQIPTFLKKLIYTSVPRRAKFNISRRRNGKFQAPVAAVKPVLTLRFLG